MADYSFGGTEEENAELKKLNAEVVRSNLYLSFAQMTTDTVTHSSTIQIASRTGRN